MMRATNDNFFETLMCAFIDSMIDKIDANRAAAAKTNSANKKSAKAKATCNSGNCDGCVGCTCGDEYSPRIENIVDHIIFNDPATVIYWVDGSKTVVKCGPEDTFSKEQGVAMAVLKKVFGDNYYRQICRVIDNSSFDSKEYHVQKSKRKNPGAIGVEANVAETKAIVTGKQRKPRKPRAPKDEITDTDSVVTDTKVTNDTVTN